MYCYDGPLLCSFNVAIKRLNFVDQFLSLFCRKSIVAEGYERVCRTNLLSNKCQPTLNIYEPRDDPHTSDVIAV